ncbi:MAG: hypothetical protein ACP6IY_09350 [Promethearchaeia archaeon]
MRRKTWKLILLVPCIFCFSINILSLANAEEEDTYTPTYEWYRSSNPYDPSNPPSREEIERAWYETAGVGYCIERVRLDIYYPTQNIQIWFYYLDRLGYNDQNELVRDRQIILLIFYYGNDGTYYRSEIGIGFPIVEKLMINNNSYEVANDMYSVYLNYKISDVFFREDGKTLCWNVSIYNNSYYITNEQGNNLGFLNTSVDLTFSVKAITNKTLDFSLDTTIYVIKSINISSVKFRTEYGYTLMDWNRNIEIPPDFDDLNAWYSHGEYGISALISATDCTTRYKNGTIITKPTDDLWIEEYNWDRNAPDYPQWDVDGKYYRWIVSFPEEPLNGSNALISLFYDPNYRMFYAVRNYMWIPIICTALIPMITVFIKRYKKSEIKEDN